MQGLFCYDGAGELGWLESKRRVSMLQIILEPHNPLDLKPEELKDLAQEIAKLDTGFDVRIAGEGYAAPAVTLAEVISIWLPEAAKQLWPILIPKICDLFFVWAKDRFKKDPTKRKKYANLVGPDGKVIKSILVKDSSQEPEDVTTQDDYKDLPRKRPPLK